MNNVCNPSQLNAYFNASSTAAILPNDIALNSTGDARFSGKDVLNFLHTRYSVLTGDDILNNNTSSFKLPLYDKYGRQIFFPLQNNVDSTNKTIYFPITDLYGNVVSYPLKDKNGEVVSYPTSTEHLLSPAQAYDDIDEAFSRAKDAHAFDFVQFLSGIEQTGTKISLFEGGIVNNTKTLNFFAAAIFKKETIPADLANINSSNLDFIIRYYPDRSSLVYSLYKEKNNNILKTYIDTNATANSSPIDIMASNQNSTAAANIVATDFWSKDSKVADFTNNKIKVNLSNQVMMSLYNSIISIQNQIGPAS